MSGSHTLPAWRRALAMLRLLLLLSLSGYLALATALHNRTVQEYEPTLAEPTPQLAPTPFLGINIALEQATPAQRRAALQRLRHQGFEWVRQRLDWGHLEPAPGHMLWQLSDGLLQDMIVAGLVPVIVLDGSPAWARAPDDVAPTANPLAPPADPATFARFVAAFAARYQHSLRYYQLWDEPNIAPHWGNRRIEPVAYAQLLKAVVPVLRAADPDAVVITAALAPTRDRGHLAIDEVYFLQRLYAAGAAPFFDVVAAQPFGFGDTPDDGRARPDRLNFQRVRLLRSAMLAAGDGHKPIWAVRYGWNTAAHSPWRTVSAADQMAFATRALTLAHQQWPWLTAMAWAIDQPAAPLTDPQWGFALTPPLAAAFQNWQSTQPQGRVAAAVPPLRRWDWAGLLGLWLLVGWRTVAALRLLPWTQWRHAYVGWRTWGKGVSWLAVVLFYYFVTWPPLIVIGWLLLVLLMLPNRLAGLAGVAVLLPFYFQHKEVALLDSLYKMPPAHAALLCLGVALSSHYCSTKDSGWRNRVFAKNAVSRCQLLHPLDWLAGAWVLLSLCTAINVWHWSAYRQGVLALVLWPVFAYLAVRLLVTTPARQQVIGGALFVGGSLAALIGLGMWGVGQGTPADGVLRLVGPYFSPNHTALYLERSWWLGLGLVLTWQGRQRAWGWAALAGIGLALWLTASRGAWLLGMPTGAIIFSWKAGLRQVGRNYRLPQLTKRTVLLGLSVIVILFLLGGMALGSPLWQRLTNSTTVTERLVIWQATLQLWRDHWWLGVGPEGFFWRYPSYLTWSDHADPNLLHPHNLWLEIVAGWGALGLIWFLLVVWQVWRLGAAVLNCGQPAWLRSGLLAALAAGIAHGQVDAFGALPDLALWNWLALGLLVAMKQTQRQAERTAGSLH